MSLNYNGINLLIEFNDKQLVCAISLMLGSRVQSWLGGHDLFLSDAHVTVFQASPPCENHSLLIF